MLNQLATVLPQLINNLTPKGRMPTLADFRFIQQGWPAAGAKLASKAAAGAVAYKTWLAGIAKAVAEAAPEGGFLGFGGTQVSDAEKATVGDIATALGVPAPAL